MNASEILNFSRHRLAALASVSQPLPSPLSISDGLAKSLLQKSVRRGRKDLALQAAATLLVGDPAALWRRLSCTAAEDIGLGDVDALGVAVAALGGKRLRLECGGEWLTAAAVVTALCTARNADHPMTC